MIIDFHTHIFPDKIAEKTIHNLALASRTKPFSDGSAGALASSMKRADITYSVNLPVVTRVEQVEKINTSMIENREKYQKMGILVFGGMHPDYPDYKKELRRLKASHIPGIKLQPAYLKMPLDDPRMMRVIDCACEEDLIVLVHAGVDIGYPVPNYCTVPMILQVIDKLHPKKFVLAHMGGWDEWDEVERDLTGADVFFDTAFSIGNVTPNPESDKPPMRLHQLSDESFVHIARKHGTDRILFGTDSPWSDQADYVSRIKKMGFSESEKAQIFSENALRLLNL